MLIVPQLLIMPPGNRIRPSSRRDRPRRRSRREGANRLAARSSRLALLIDARLKHQRLGCVVP